MFGRAYVVQVVTITHIVVLYNLGLMLMNVVVLKVKMNIMNFLYLGVNIILFCIHCKIRSFNIRKKVAILFSTNSNMSV